MQDRLAGAIIGFGFIAERGHLHAYRRRPDRFAILAIADVCPARRARALAELPDVRVYETADELLAAEAHRLDFVDIATPPSEHAPIAHAALARGLHVICEKPLATTTADARALLEHAADARRVLLPSHNYHHAPVIRAVRELLATVDLGPISRVDLHTLRPTHARGTPEWLPDWRRVHRHAGGGIAMDHASHSFYLAFDWLGGYPTSIQAHTQHLAGLDTEDELSCVVTFPTGTAVARLTWNADVRRVIYALHGERGLIRVEDDVIELTEHATQHVTRISSASEWMDASHAGWFVGVQADLVAAIETEDFVGRAALDAFHAVRLIEAAYASAAANGAVTALPTTPSLQRRRIAG